jgi:Uma2 family endonuclease
MAADPRYRRLSVEEYLRLVQTSQDVKYEYEYGQVRALAGGTSNHAEIAGNMYVALREHLGRRTPCRAYIADKVVQVAEGRYYIPDVVVSRDVSDHGKAVVICSPHLIVEVLSPSTELIDRTKKLAAYRACEHVQEIVFISQQVQFVEVFRRAHEDDEDAWHYLQYHAAETIILESLDIQIPVAELYEGLAIPTESEER